MKQKDYEPLKLDEFQSTIELWMYYLDNPTKERLEKIKYDLQCKIDYHIREKLWI